MSRKKCQEFREFLGERSTLLKQEQKKRNKETHEGSINDISNMGCLK
jgi:hypothetical protein